MLLAIGSYFVRMVVVTAAYHRYFSHRAFKTSRAFQFLLALGAQIVGAEGRAVVGEPPPPPPQALGRRRRTSTRRGGAASGTRTSAGSSSPTGTHTNTALVGDLAKFPELRFLNHSAVSLLPAVALGARVLSCSAACTALVWGFFVSTVLLWHGSFSINSLSHLFGKRRYATTDDSRNNWSLALLTIGEGWHNNHHHYQSSANQGFRWWEIDVTYYVLRVLECCGIVWDLRRPPAAVIAGT